jgi:C-terminal processing protease CtpA/Prc
MAYSATNDFVCRMKESPMGIIVGDKTGGGGGLPLSSELPNGWLIRFSSSPMYDSQMQSTEFGIDPDYPVALSATDQANGIDTIIEKAITLIK